MATMYDHVPDSLVAEGRLWLPDLSLSLLGNDWSLEAVPFDMELPLDTHTTGLTSYVTLAQIEVRFPDSWTYDDQYDAGLTMRLVIEIEHRSQDGNQNYNLKIAEPSPSTIESNVVVYGISSFQYDEFTIDYDNTTTWPTGSQTYNIQAQFTSTSPSSTMEYQRVFGSRGPTCRYEVVLV